MTQTTVLEILPPPPFHFEYTVYSHGWAVLHPNRWDAENRIFRRVERLNDGTVVLLTISGNGSPEKPVIRVQVDHAAPLSEAHKSDIHRAVGHMLRLDEDLSPFYVLCSKFGEPWQQLGAGMGRLLRSPGLFEDVVKVICTTNIQWGGTKRLVEGLVNAFGDPFPGNVQQKTFPVPEAIAGLSPETFGQQVNLGYRTAYVHEFASNVANGKLNLSAFSDPDIPTPELRKRLLAIKGVGNYAAASLLMLLGRYDALPVDSVFNQFVSRKYFNGNDFTTKEGEAIYEKWGEWKYLAYWFEIWQGFDEQV